MMTARALCVLVSVLGLFLSSCDTAETKGELFYPVDSLLNSQAELLTKTKALLNKSASMGNDLSSASYVPGSVEEWKKELEIFYHINTINKPVNKTEYAVAEAPATGENLQVKTFTSKGTLPVREFRVYFKKSVRSPVRIEADLREDNSMYEGTQQLVMMFDDLDQRSILKAYSIKGGQETFLADSVNFSIRGDITITR